MSVVYIIGIIGALLWHLHGDMTIFEYYSIFGLMCIGSELEKIATALITYAPTIRMQTTSRVVDDGASRQCDT